MDALRGSRRDTRLRCTYPCQRKRRIWKSKMIWQEVGKKLEIVTWLFTDGSKSPEGPARLQSEDFQSIKKELRTRKGCSIS